MGGGDYSALMTMSEEAVGIFNSIDTNGDGVLTLSELTCRLSDFGMVDEEIAQLFAKIDVNADGHIDAEEWEQGFTAFRETTEFRRLEGSILEALIAARSDPSATGARIEARRACYDGKTFNRPARPGVCAPPPNVTKEGVSAVDDALLFLKSQSPLPGFAKEAGHGLALSGADHVADIGTEGVASHTGSDESGCWDRQSRYGEWSGACGECLWYGNAEPVTGETIIDDLIVDDGVPSRGHRLAVFDERYNIAGVSIGRHSTFGAMVAIEFAAAYEDDPVAAATRRGAGPPVLDHSSKRKGGTCWQLGRCRGCALEIKGGRVVEVPHLGKWHADCFVCSKCEMPLAGVKEKKEENRRIFCQACWVDLFAKECFVCGKKISGERVVKGDKYRHPKCKPCPGKAGGAPTKGSKPMPFEGPMMGAGKAAKGPVKKTLGKSPAKRSPMPIGAGALASMYGDLE